MAQPVRVTIYDTQIDRLFLPGGQVWHTMGLIGSEHLSAAIAFAPKRTGHLASSHYPVAILTPYKKRGVRYTIRNDAEYALYVHEGTRMVEPIRGERKYIIWDIDGVEYESEPDTWMSIPATRGSVYRKWVNQVRGQDPNPWIERAAEMIATIWG